MRGWRKFAVIVLYLVCVTFIAFAVVFWRYDTLAGVGLYAAGMASGVAAFMWGNAKAKEHGEKTQS